MWRLPASSSRSCGPLEKEEQTELAKVHWCSDLRAVLRESGLSRETLREVYGAVWDDEVRDAPSEPCWTKQSGV